MGAEQTGKHAAGGKGLNDEERRSRGRNVHGNALVVGAEFLECANQALRLTYHAGTGSIGSKLALPRDPELNKHGGDRREEKHK